MNVSKEAEMITVSIKLGNKQLMITSYYRPPNKQDIKYVESTITEIQNLKSKNKNHIFLLGGDFNLPDINWKMNDVKLETKSLKPSVKLSSTCQQTFQYNK